MSGVPPILYSEGSGIWSRIEKTLKSGGPVELIIPQGGNYDALRVGDHVLTLPRMIDIAEGSALVIKLGEQGKLELVKIIPPVPSTELSVQPPIIGLDQIDPELMEKVFEVLFEELDNQLSESKLSQRLTQVPFRSPTLPTDKSGVSSVSPKATLMDFENQKPLERAIELFLNQPEIASKLIATVRNELILLSDDEFMARLLGSRVSQRANSAIDIERLLKIPVGIIAEAGGGTSEFLPPRNVSGESVQYDTVLLRTLIKEFAIEIGENDLLVASSGNNSILDILKAAVVWLKNQSPLPADRHLAHLFSKLNALIEQHLNVDSLDIETFKPLVSEIQLLAKALTNEELPLVKDFPSPYPRVSKVVSLIERIFGQLQEGIECSHQENFKKKTRVARANYQFAELPIVEIRNRLLEQFRVLERLNTSLLLDGRILFCLPFLVGVHPEPVFGELRRGEDEEEADSGVPTSSIRPDIRFEVDFRKLGHVLGVIFMRRKRISLFFENKDARNFCSGQLRLLSDLLGEEWMIEIDLKARYLNKKITA